MTGVELYVEAETPAQSARYDGRLERVTLDSVRGWACDLLNPTARLEVELLLDERVVAKTLAAEWREDLVQARIGDGNHAFVFHHALGNESVRVRIAGTDHYLESLDPWPVEPLLGLARRSSGNADASEESANIEAASLCEIAMRLQVERITIDRSGLLRTSGWIVAHARIEIVEIFVNDRLVGAAEYSLERSDVASAWPDYEGSLNSGFAYVGDVSDEEGEICVAIVARAAGDIRRRYETKILRPTPAINRRSNETLEFECDQVSLTASGIMTLRGWAISSAGIKDIEIDFEGECVGRAELGGSRPDVGNKFPRISGSRQCGYSFLGKVHREKIRREHVLDVILTLGDEKKRSFKVGVAVQSGIEAPTSLAQDITLFLDHPTLADGRMTQPITSGLPIAGWALSHAGIRAISIEVDNLEAGSAYMGMRREDIAAAFPEYEDALLSGFAYTLPQRAISGGRHTVTVKATSQDGEEHKVDFEIDVAAAVEPEGPWSLRRKMNVAERLIAKSLAKEIRSKTYFSIWLKCDDVEVDSIRLTLRSIKQQICDDSEIVPIGLAPEIPLQRLADEFKGLIFSDARDPAVAPDGSARAGDGRDTWIMPLDAGDVLSTDALFEFALFVDQWRGCDFVYGDDRRLNVASGRMDAFFKPDWSPDLLSSTNYIGRAFCVRSRVVNAARLSPTDLLTFGQYDFVLRCSECAERIEHIPQVVCQFASNATEIEKIEIKALQRALKRRGIKAKVQRGRISATYRTRYRRVDRGLVSIIIPTCAARGLVKGCIESLKRVTAYKNIEIVCIDNIRDRASEWKKWLKEHADLVVDIPDAFNWSRFNNLAARQAHGEYLLFLNDDIEVIERDWLDSMLEIVVRPDVGVVGPQLLYPDRKVQHAGLYLSSPSIARHAFRFCGENDPGYCGLALTQRNVIALTGACMLVRNQVFHQLGGFDENHSVINNDLDFCLRAHASKLLNVYTPFAKLIHHELASRVALKDEHDASAFAERWEAFALAGDPFFHPHLSKKHDSYQYDAEPTSVIVAGHLYQAEEIKRILALKVDHIGDFFTAFPAFRRIKEHFPSSTLFVLASPAAKQLAALEPAIDEVIPFEFFHTRSGLGQKEITEEQRSELAASLGRLDLDLAIDLRKHPDSRPLLQSAGAKWTAGFDWRNQFPWIDIALTWDGDVQAMRKRQHVADDLINLVDAVASAGRSTRNFIKRSSAWSAAQFPVASRLAREGLYSRRVVCVHPASGTEMRQWPPTYFAKLADMLIKEEDVDIAVIGGSDEANIAEQMIQNVAHKERVTSLVGRLQLGELPYFLETCSLFVGNNSGPKHIAAALGVPTVGIHSGVVDPHEWGPLGEIAVAIRREMTCAPCYWAKREDCHRNLACLTELGPASVLSISRKLLRASRGISYGGG